jgi:hypothetical protein
MKTHLTLVAALSILATTAACKKDEAKAGDKAAAKSGDQAAPTAKPQWMKLGALGIEAEVPADATVDDNTSGAGFPAATIWTTPTTFVFGGGDLSPVKADLDGAKAEIQKDPNPFKSFTKEEKTATGWRLEYELESMIDKKPVYGVQIRTTIDGVPYDCGSNTGSTAERDNVIKICSSLRKAS